MSAYYYGIEDWMKNNLDYDLKKAIDIDFCEGFGIYYDYDGNLYVFGDIKSFDVYFKTESKNFPYYQCIKVPISLKVEKIACGYQHIMFISQSNVYAMGLNNYGQCGIEQSTKIVNKPNKIELPDNFIVKDVQCGERHTLILSDDGCIYTLGSNEYGQCGTLSNTDNHIPKPMEYIKHLKIEKISCGALHSILLDEYGDVYSLGWNGHCQLGTGDSEDRKIADLVEELDFPVVDISAGLWCTFVINDEGELWYFGTIYWDGEPWKGNQNKVSSSLPTKLHFDGKVKRMSFKSRNICFEVENSQGSQIYEIGQHWPPKIIKDTKPKLLKSTHFGVFFTE